VVKLEYSNYSVADDAQIKNLPLGDGLPTVDADMDLNFNSVNLALSVMF